MIKKLENRKWRVLKSTPLLNLGPWLNVRQEVVELPNGTQIPAWFVMDFPNWVNVIAITKEGDFVMIDQYRHALGETHYELVAGVVDEGETPLHAAMRELSEETGYSVIALQLAWIADFPRKYPCFSIISASKVHQLEESLGACKITLTPDMVSYLCPDRKQFPDGLDLMRAGQVFPFGLESTEDK